MQVLQSTVGHPLILIVVSLNKLLIQVTVAPQTAALKAGAHKFAVQAE